MIRLVAVMTHPVQYLSPLFRHLSTRCPEIKLTVLYAVEPTPAQQGVGFGVPLTWDVPLLSGHDAVVLRRAQPGDSVSDRDFALDAPALGEQLRALEPDVIWCAGWHARVQLRAIAWARLHRRPVLYRGENWAATDRPPLARALRLLKNAAALRLFTHWLAIGRHARDWLERLGLPASRIFDSPYAVDNQRFADAAAPLRRPEERARIRGELGLPSGPVALFAGKLQPWKRPLDLVRAAERAGAALLFAGAGELLDEARRLCAALGVRASFAGFVNQRDMPRLYAAADCLVLPSEKEPWGLVINEALSSGLPCVVSDRVGCAPDLIDERSGRVFPVGDIAALAAAIGQTIDGDRAAGCRAAADRCSLARAADGLVAACRSAAG